jgi:1-acyl-sn-glycerol-3-phosphate acyltransferase
MANAAVSPSIGSEEMRRYRLPRRPLASFLLSAVALRPRSFAHDARLVIGGLDPAPEVRGGEQIPALGPCLVTCNHYSRPGLGAWWTVLAITAALADHRTAGADTQVRWVMAGAWTYPRGNWRGRVWTPLTGWAFDRVARIYGFVTMPPMPPDPGQVEARAMAVLRTLRLARRLVQEGGVLGLAPEGRDACTRDGCGAGVPGGPGEPPKGAGEFMALLVRAGLPILPVGVAEPGGRLCLSFGPPFVPDMPADRDERERAVAGQVMAAIGRQLPRE